jgi:hypothetical protein
MTTYHIYFDESCHLEHDGHKVMVLGAIRCPKESRREVAVAAPNSSASVTNGCASQENRHHKKAEAAPGDGLVTPSTRGGRTFPIMLPRYVHGKG